MKLIPLTQGKFAKVDDADYQWLNQWAWRFVPNGYARRAAYVDGKRVGDVHMHRLINGTPDGMDTDHINRDKLDNRRSNLRSVSRSLNNFNTAPPRNNTSGVKGVWWSARWARWYAQICINGKRLDLGSFLDFDKAVEARRKAESELVML